MKIGSRLVVAVLVSAASMLIAIRLFQNEEAIWYFAGFIIMSAGFLLGLALGPWQSIRTLRGIPQSNSAVQIIRVCGIVLALCFAATSARYALNGGDLVGLTVDTVAISSAITIAGFGSRQIWFAIANLSMFAFDLWVFAVSRHLSALGAVWICLAMAGISLWLSKLPIGTGSPKSLHPQSSV
jgi:hypothetical protein